MIETVSDLICRSDCEHLGQECSPEPCIWHAQGANEPTTGERFILKSPPLWKACG